MDISKLNEQLEEFDSSKSPLDEFDISKEIGKLREANDNTEAPLEWRAEKMAFDFCEDNQNKDTGWGTYYGPMFVIKNDDGTYSEGPSIQAITPEIMNYWKQRADKTTHPVLKARYLGLVWDFSETITGGKPSHEIALAYIDALIEVAEKQLQEHEADVRAKLKRAIELSLSLNATDRLEKAREVTIEYHKSVLRDDAPGYWSLAYDLLLKNKKVNTTPEQEKAIIDDLEGILSRVEEANQNVEHIDPWRYEHVALPLADYYRRNDRAQDLERVIKLIGLAFEKASEKAEPMLASAWLQHIQQIYSSYGFTDDASRVLVKIREIGPSVNESLKSVSVKQEISVDEINKFVNAFVDEDLDTALRRVAIHFVPKKDEVAELVQKLSEDNPFTFLINRQIQDHKGRVVATVGGIDEDLDAHVVLQLSQNMQFGYFFLRHVYEGIHTKFEVTAEKVIDFLYQSPVFSENKKEIIKRGVEAYLEEDFLVAVHLLIPQIEDVIRNLFELSDVPIIIPNKEGGYNFMAWGGLLSHPLFKEVFGDDGVLYFRVLFTENKGWNLRHDLCHGLMLPESFHQQNADRVMHALLCLALIRKKEE